MRTPIEFNALRLKARDNRDKAIATAREEYAAVFGRSPSLSMTCTVVGPHAASR